MRLEGISARSELQKKFRQSRGRVEHVSVRHSQVAEFEAVGWEVTAMRKTRARLQRERPLADFVELLTWRVMYLCGFPHLSGDGGAKLIRGEGVENQLDVVAYDEESAVVVECKSSERGVCNIDVQAELNTLNEHLKSVREILNRDSERDDRLKVGGILVLYNVPYTPADSSRAKEMKLTIFDKPMLEYYERLAGIIGSAARYQLFGEVLEGQSVPGLSLKLPAVAFALGDSRVYSFAIRPADLLKVSFVAHRGRGDDAIETYQRMVSKQRLKNIAAFIDEGGVFPTNIVINFQRKSSRSRLRFDAVSREEGAAPGSRVGYLTIPSIYQAAWIIDGQHRLLAYSDHEWATTASLAVTAFDGLDGDTQAELFEKINSKQKKVSANLLAELFSTLHWNSPVQKLQVRAVASQVAQDLRSRESSPLYERILGPDEKSTELRCITMTELVNGLQRPEMFVRSEHQGRIRQYGVLWAGTADASRSRATAIVTAWFESIRNACPEMWELGNDKDLGLVATNRGVNASLRVLSWALTHLRNQQRQFDGASEQDVIDAIEPYAQLAGEFFAALSGPEVASSRRLYGTGAAVEIAYSIGRAIRESLRDFEAEGLLDWIERKSRLNVNEAQELCTSLERRLTSGIIDKMREEYGEDAWWRKLPVAVRQEAVARREEDPSPEDHPPERFLNLIDLRKIIENDWQLLQQAYGVGTGSKRNKTKWLAELNEIRNSAFHAGGLRLRLEDVDALKDIDRTLTERGI